ncbi:MAG: acetate/propionate family kinase [Steroidobacteraceae bacterium]|jgi:acetate kinase
MPTVLTINGGSSSIRFALYRPGLAAEARMHGKIERIGLPNAIFTSSAGSAAAPLRRELSIADHRKAVQVLMQWLEMQPEFAAVQGVGHRIVNGLAHMEPERITPQLLAELRGIRPYDPEHLPSEIKLIEAIGERHPRLPQVACFDTAFHRSMPRVAKTLPIPRKYAAQGVQRYGFHGLSYAYLLTELARLGDPGATRGRVILAHLGNGASMAAVRDGRSIDTSMAFTPTAGLVMSTRAGDLDPGLAYYFSRTEAMSARKFQAMINEESGLLGVSETSSDVRDLLALEASDERAAEALALFCYQAKKWIGAFCAALGGLDTLVFAGGIGENAPQIRERICAGLGFLGLEFHEARNAANAGLISADQSRVAIRVIRTDEERMIAEQTLRILGLETQTES